MYKLKQALSVCFYELKPVTPYNESSNSLVVSIGLDWISHRILGILMPEMDVDFETLFKLKVEDKLDVKKTYCVLLGRIGSATFPSLVHLLL